MLRDFGRCPDCNTELEPVYFTEEERTVFEKANVKTGRVREAVDYLLCPLCGTRFIVDDSFDTSWHIKGGRE